MIGCVRLNLARRLRSRIEGMSLGGFTGKVRWIDDLAKGPYCMANLPEGPELNHSGPAGMWAAKGV